MSRTKAIVGLLALLAPGIALAPVWMLGGFGPDEDDLLYYLPSRTFFHETIRDGQAPWLNPWNGLGRPYLADPQSAVFYPTTWLFTLLDPLWAYPASLWLHYSLALWGMYRLLRAQKLDFAAALFGGIAFAFCGFLLAHRAHFTMQHAAAWAPIVFWRVGRYARTGHTTDLGWAAIASAAQCFAGHVQIAALTQLGALLLQLGAVRRSPTEGTSSLNPAPSLLRDALRMTRDAAPGLIRCGLCLFAAIGLFSVQWAPTLAYLAETTRGERGYLDFVENSWNPLSAIGWSLPMFFGQRTPNFFDQPYWGPSHQCEQFAYIGILPLLLALAAIRNGWRDDPFRRRWVILLAFSLLLALGLYGPICPLLYWLPGAGLFRVPARAMLLCDLAACALAAGAVHDLAAERSPRRAQLRAALLNWTRRPWMLMAILTAPAIILTALGLPLLPAETRTQALLAMRPWTPAILTPLLVIGLSAGALFLVAQRWNQPRGRYLLTLVLFADLALIGWSIDTPRDRLSASERIASADREAWLAPLRGSTGRLWVVTTRAGDWTPGEYVDSRFKGVANINSLDHVASLTDYGPLQPRSLDALFHFKPWGETDDAPRLLDDSRWMDTFNVEWVLLCDDVLIAPRGAELIGRTERGYRLYRNPGVRGRAFLEDACRPAVIRVSQRSNHEFSVIVDSWPSGANPSDADPSASQSTEDVTLVTDRLYLPGWTARVGPYGLPVVSAAGALLATRVPEGMALRVDFRYFPPGLIPGAVLSGLMAVALLCVVFADWMRRLLRRRPGERS